LVVMTTASSSVVFLCLQPRINGVIYTHEERAESTGQPRADRELFLTS
jgi:hypothetical protein